MNMQDKDLDQLFRSKLEGLETEPSAGVWANISSELSGPKQRKSIMPVLRIAASVIILISAGLLFLPKKQLVADKPKNRIAINLPVKKHQALPVANNPAPVYNIAQVLHTNTTKLHQTLAIVNQINMQASPLKVEQPLVTDPANNQQQVLAAVETDNINKPVVPDINVPLTNKTLTGTLDMPVKPIATLAAVSADKEPNLIPAKKHKIHSLGSFINAVVSVVDKREDKIIEFTDTDDGNTVTGINLGIISVKKNQ